MFWGFLCCRLVDFIVAFVKQERLVSAYFMFSENKQLYTTLLLSLIFPTLWYILTRFSTTNWVLYEERLNLQQIWSTFVHMIWSFPSILSNGYSWTQQFGLANHLTSEPYLVKWLQYLTRLKSINREKMQRRTKKSLNRRCVIHNGNCLYSLYKNSQLPMKCLFSHYTTRI